jgi:hypothetical protein
LLRRYFLGHAHVLILRQKNQQPPCDADLRCQTGALGADRVFKHLHHDGLTYKKLSFNRFRLAGCRRIPFGGISLGVPVVDAAHEVCNMQKRSAVQADVNEGGLHAGQDPHHLTQVDITDKAPLERALHVQLLHSAVLHHGDPAFLGGPIDQNFLRHGDRLDSNFQTGSAQNLRTFVQRQAHDA